MNVDGGLNRTTYQKLRSPWRLFGFTKRRWRTPKIQAKRKPIVDQQQQQRNKLLTDAISRLGLVSSEGGGKLRETAAT